MSVRVGKFFSGRFLSRGQSRVPRQPREPVRPPTEEDVNMSMRISKILSELPCYGFCDQPEYSSCGRSDSERDCDYMEPIYGCHEKQGHGCQGGPEYNSDGKSVEYGYGNSHHMSWNNVRDDSDLDFMFNGSCQQLLGSSCGELSDSSSSDDSFIAMPPGGGVEADPSTTMPVTIVGQILQREKAKQMTKSMSLPLSHESPDPFPELTSAPVTPTLCQTRVTKSSPSSPVVRRYGCRMSPFGSSLVKSQENLSSVQPVETMVNFYSGEGSCKPVLINGDMTTLDICHRLVEKNHAMPDRNWAVIERIAKFNLERTLEDHESVFDVYHSWSGAEKNRLYFRKDFRKYDFFKHPTQFFPAHMLDIKDLQTRAEKFALASRPEVQLNILLQNVFGSLETMPDVQGTLCMKEGKRSWKKHFFVLRGSGLYYSTKGTSKDPRHLVAFTHFDDVNIYSTIDAKKTFGAPTNHCLCLKMPGSGSDVSKLKLLCAEDEEACLCWLTGMRLVKYGSRLRENLKMSIRYDTMRQQEEKDRFKDAINKAEEFGIARVPMDFTGAGGRIVNDPNEALGVAIEEVHNWRKKAAMRPVKSPLSCSPNGVSSSENPIYSSVHGLGSGLHMTQPWFHSGLCREEAVNLITEHGLVDGVFLIRQSLSLSDTFVLTLCHSHHVKHCQIIKVESDGELYYSLDGGHTKFLDLIQLVDFYQLNAAGLPTRLTYYVTKLL